MGWLDDPVQGLRRIMNPRGLEFGADSQAIRESIENLSTEEAARVLRKLEASNALDPDELAVLKAIFEAAHETGRQADGALLAVKDIVTQSHRISGKAGFKIPYIQSYYKQWRKAQAPGAPKSPEDFLKYQASRAEQGLGDTKLLRVLNTFLGSTYDYTRGATRTRQVADRWPTLRLLYRPVAGARNCAEELARNFSTLDELKEGVQASFAHIEDIIARHPEQAGDLRRALEHFKTLEDGDEQMAGLIAGLFAKYAPDGNFSEAAARKLIGKRSHDPQQVIDEVVMSHLILFRELDSVRAAKNGSPSAEQLFDHFMRVEGAEGFFELVLRRAGYEHGYVFEQLLTFNVLAKMLDEGADFGLEAAERVVLQSRIDDLCGPDLLIINMIDGKMVATVVQAKSYRQLTSLIRVTRGEGGSLVAKGEILVQARKDIRRLMGAGGLNQAFDGAPNIGLSRYEGVLRSKIDWNRLQRERLDVDMDQIRQSFSPGMRDSKTGKLISELTHDQILSSRNPIISQQVRKHVIDRHLRQLEDAANEDLLGFARTLAEEATMMSLNGFRKTYPAPASGPAALAHARVWQAISDGAEPDVIAPLFETYYREFFGLSEGGVRLEFDLFDVLTDDDVTRAAVGRGGN